MGATAPLLRFRGDTLVNRSNILAAELISAWADQPQEHW